MNVVSVKFKDDGKAYFFDSVDISVKNNDYVLVETEKGIQFGKIFNDHVEKYNASKELKRVIKLATNKDYNDYLENLKLASQVLCDTRKKVVKDNIPMTIIDASFTFDRSQLILNFVADSRVDFRDLVKYLAAKYKTHIELHQLGVRDKAKEVGGIGQCGRELCCKQFKNNMDGISINMAKNQNISLNPTKINGCCGRLLCCLSYEDDNYKLSRNVLPKLNEVILVNKEKAKVISVDLLKRKVIVDINGEEKVVDYNDK